MTVAMMPTAMTIVADEANALDKDPYEPAYIYSPTKLANEDADDRTMNVEDFDKIVDYVPQKKHLSSRAKLLNSNVDESKMAAKDSKIHATGSIKDDSDGLSLDNKDIDDSILGVLSSLARNN